MSTTPLDQLTTSLQALSDTDRDRLCGQFQQILTDPLYQDILDGVCKIHTDPAESKLSRQKVLKRVKRFVNCSGVDYRKDVTTGDFDPSLSYKMIVKICFTGIGTEHDEDHYGIVWESKMNRDHVLVVATTSYKDYQKYHNHFFNIGQMGFLQGETIAMIHQVGPISRKRILYTSFKDPADGQYKVISLSKAQEDRIKDGFRVVCLGFKTLFEYILESQRRFIPEFANHNDQYLHLWRPFKIVSHTPGVKTVYSLLDEPTVHYEIQWHRCGVSRSEREYLLKRWRDAVAVYDMSVRPKRRIKTREQAIQEAYNALLSKKKAAGGAP